MVLLSISKFIHNNINKALEIICERGYLQISQVKNPHLLMIWVMRMFWLVGVGAIFEF